MKPTNATAVQGRLYGQGDLIVRELGHEEQRWVDRIVRQVSSGGRWRPFQRPASTAPVIDGVLAERVSHTETAELGPALLGWQIWRRLGMPELLRVLGFNRAQGQAAAISVINRLVDPGSEHGLLDWYRRTGLPELTASGPNRQTLFP